MGEVDPKELQSCARTCAAANVRRASRAVTKLYGEFMAETGLEPTQYALLVACSLAGAATVSKLAGIFAMDRSALARNLSVMEKRGLVKVTAGEDRRTRKVALTAVGTAALANALPRWRAAQTRVEQKFGSDRLQHLVAELRALTSAAASK
jgi:DNA-binding MarR family transcriptional regulator